MTRIKNIKWMIYIFALIFSFQAILMPGSMAAGHIAGAEDSTVSLVKQVTTKVIAIGFSAAGTKFHPQDKNSNVPQDTSCCTIGCGCTSLLVPLSPLISAQQSGIKNTFYLVHLAEPPSFVLPDPPRTTKI